MNSDRTMTQMTSKNDGTEAALLLRYGCHRVQTPSGCLPQAAERLCAAGIAAAQDPPADVPSDWPSEWPRGWIEHELHLAVERLNIDSASFRQMEEEAQGAGEDPAEGAQRRVLATVAARGKMHNPVTGSGGMLLGRVTRVGAHLPADFRALRPGDLVATLVSLTLTPLRLSAIEGLDLARHQLAVRGGAVLFASGAFARLPPASELPETVALAALDVAGAAPQVDRLVRDLRARSDRAGQGVKVLLLGCGGKSGLLCAAAARRAGAARVVGVEATTAGAEAARRLGACDTVLLCDATDALGLAQAALHAGGGEYDLTVSCVNVAGAEMAAILATRDRGVVYFFSMATSFTRAALGAEGAGKDIDMLVGNGYCHGHAEMTLRLLAEDRALRDIFVARY